MLNVDNIFYFHQTKMYHFLVMKHAIISASNISFTSLQKLTGPPLDAEVRSGNVRHIALTTKGWMLESHIDTVKFVSQMQWKFGIFGSVGEIGVYYGKFASVLATYTATEYGERFFVCDIFGNPKHMKMKTEEGRKDKFEQAMNQVGFSMYGQNEPKRVRVWDDSSLYLSKMSYKAMGLAAFRFFSIDGNHHEPYVLGDLVHVTCILREGGIIAMDDYGNSKWPGVAEAMTNYVIMYGSKIVVPLLILRSKMYMCTASWHNTYIKYIEQAGIAKKMHWCQRTKNVLGIRSTVYTNC